MILTLTIVLLLLSLLWILDGFRLRKRSKALRLISPVQDAGDLSEYRVITKATAHPDKSMQKGAIAYAKAQDLDALILAAQPSKTCEALVSMQAVNPENLRSARMGSARLQGEFMVVRHSLIEKMGIEPVPPQNGKDFAKLGNEFKKFAFLSTDVAVMKGLPHSSTHKLALDSELLRYYFGPIGAPWLFVQLLLLILGFAFTPYIAAIALIAYMLQPLLTLKDTLLHGPDLYRYALLRPLLDAQTMFVTLFSKGEDAKVKAKVLEEKREEYKRMLSHGTEAFFDARREDCPICGAHSLSKFISTSDRIQFKPGIFHMDQCESCSHIFQNPRLSIAGLEFYYKDFYDGLGEEKLDGIFGQSNAPYLARAKMMQGKEQPSRWLDVGGGHGHFCLYAREVFPGTKFDGLDLASSVLEAEKKGWTDKSYRGLFPDLADRISRETSYDVVSMSHYLEHTRDPKIEIEAAAKILPRGGHLLIELPDPECRFGKIFKSFWLPWFQPQHQHFLSAANLERLLKENGFEAVTWHRGEAHHPFDIMVFFGLLVLNIARPVDLPWLPAKASRLRPLFNATVFTLAFPLLLIARTLDHTLAPFLRRPGWSNAYRVLARRNP